MALPRCSALLPGGALAILLACVACRVSGVDAETGEPAKPVVVERVDSMMVLHTELALDGSLCAPTSASSPAGERLDAAALPVAARRDGSDFAFRRHADGAPIHYLVFEREGEASAYGVYGLAGAKNDLPVPPPLLGDAVEWSGLDHEAALRRQLGYAGVGEREADSLLAGHREAWFAEGLRVFFVLNRENAAGLGERGEAPALRAALLCVELPRE